MDDHEGRLKDHLQREIEPPSHLGPRVMRTLHARGLLAGGASQRRRAITVVAAIAVALALFASGVVIGSRSSAAPAIDQASARFILLLYEDEGFSAEHEADELVAEYRNWAAQVRSSGGVIGGEKLDANGVLLEGSTGTASTSAQGDGGAGRLTGYFMIAAPNRSAAVAIARTCPHLRHGGRIEVRRIVPT